MADEKKNDKPKKKRRRLTGGFHVAKWEVPPNATTKSLVLLAGPFESTQQALQFLRGKIEGASKEFSTADTYAVLQLTREEIKPQLVTVSRVRL